MLDKHREAMTRKVGKDIQKEIDKKIIEDINLLSRVAKDCKENIASGDIGVHIIDADMKFHSIDADSLPKIINDD
jgi:hypothetical protein